jgi:hypothetical protein
MAETDVHQEHFPELSARDAQKVPPLADRLAKKALMVTIATFGITVTITWLFLLYQVARAAVQWFQ